MDVLANLIRTGAIPMYGGIPVKESNSLIGTKIAVKLNGTINVSPAMLHLMRTASPSELETLLDSIKLVDMDPPPPSIESMVEACDTLKQLLDKNASL